MTINPEKLPSGTNGLAPLEHTFPQGFSDDSRFVQEALAEYLRRRHLPSLLFYELSPAEQSNILDKAQELKRRRGGA